MHVDNQTTPLKSIAKVSEIAPPEYDKIPQELKDQPLWVNFLSEWEPEKNKWSKPPCNQNGVKSKGGFNNAVTFDEARAAQERHPNIIKGVGFSFATKGGTPIVGLDFDHVVLEDGSLIPEVAAILDNLDTYAEYSISGDGVHAFVEAEKFTYEGKAKTAFNNAFGPGTGFEVFISTGYMTVSGKRLEGYSTTVRKKAKTKLDTIIATIARGEKKKKKRQAKQTVEAVKNASGDPRFKELQGFVEHFEKATGIKVTAVKPRPEGSQMLKLDRCPWGGGENAERTHHDDGPDDAVVFFTPGARPTFHCFHTTCDRRTWVDLCNLFPELARGDFIDEYNAEYAIVSHGKDVWVSRLTEEDAATEIITTAKLRHSFAEERMSDKLVIKTGEGDDESTETIYKAQVWFESPHAKRYPGGFVFKPNNDQRPTELNTWKGFAIPASEKGSWTLLHDHIRDVICDGDLAIFNWFMMWCADIIQNPGDNPPDSSIVLKGGQGSGKGTVAEALGAILGPLYYTETGNKEELYEKHNEHMAKSILIQGAEITFKGDKPGHNRLKDTITKKTQNMNPKYKAVVKVKNVSRYIITTNAETALPAELSERRFLILNVDKKKERSTAFFDKLRAELENGGLGRMHYDLKQIKVNRNELRRPPRTTALKEEIRTGLTGVHRFINNILEEGLLRGWVKEDGEAAKFETMTADAWPETTTKDLLYEAYTEAMIRSGEYRGDLKNKMGFGKTFHSITQSAGIVFEPLTSNKNDKRLAVPPLDKSRELWEIFLGN